jgi:hypothetical protein
MRARVDVIVFDTDTPPALSVIAETPNREPPGANAEAKYNSVTSS